MSASVGQCVARWCEPRGVNQSNVLRHMFAPRLCYSEQTHEYLKKNSRNGNKEELYFAFTLL